MERKETATSRKISSKRRRKSASKKKWSKQVTEHSNALKLEDRVFKKKDPEKIAQSLRRSAEKSKRRKSSPFQSAMSMLNFYINRAGKGLSKAQKQPLEKAKRELRKLYHKDGE